MTTAVVVALVLIFFVVVMVVASGSSSADSDTGGKRGTQPLPRGLKGFSITFTGGEPTTIGSSSGGGITYDVDLAEQTCSCPNWTKRRSDIEKGHPARFCKHMKKAVLEGLATTRKQPATIIALLADRHEETHHLIHVKSGAIISYSPGKEWVNLYMEESIDGEEPRYGYSLHEGRWSYDREPKNAALYEELIEDIEI